MSNGKRYTAAYLGALFPETLDGEKEAVIAWNDGEEPDRWYVDLEDNRAEFRALTAAVSEGRVHQVIVRDRHVLPDNVAWNGEFFDALLATDTELNYVERGTTNPTEKFMAQVLPLLHEWNNGESAFLAERGWHTIHAGNDDVRWLRNFLAGSDSDEARRWLDRLLPDIGK